VLNVILAAAEPSKVPFYFAGGALAIWAVVLSALGLRRPTFPGGTGGARGVVGLTVILVVLAMAAAVTTG
jgi:hypothetical protein